ncbi:MAG TPA: sodium/solute symporter [Elusimicrobiota bacterium]|nr:sodium/solute symporter [Elusimicrobiota bacterium]
MDHFLLGQTSLNVVDAAVLFAVLAAVMMIGFIFGRGQESTNDFFLGRRAVPGWAACLSFIATEVSAVTIISVPAIAFMENWQYAQFFIGTSAARIVIAYLFIPAFYHYNCTTIYEFLRHRFGLSTQITSSIFFFITRLLGSGVRLMAASLAVSVLLGWHIIPSILLFTVISIAYISFGGIKAVVWTNVFQAVVFLGAGLATLAYLLIQVGGWGNVLQVAGGAGRLDIINWGPAWSDTHFLRNFMTDPNILWIAILNGFIGSLAAFGTDHDLMQRLLTVDTRTRSQRTILWTILGNFIVLSIFLTIGAALYTFYSQHPELALPDKLDKIFPHFIGHCMPGLLRGLMLSAIVMASIDSPLGSLSASFVTDIYRSVIHTVGTEKHYLFVSRVSVGIFGVILAGLAYGFSFFEKILWLAFKIGGVTFGSLLGIFLLGLLTKRDSRRANVYAMTLSAVTNLLLLVLSETKVIPLGWSWLVILGTGMTFGFGWLFGPRMK